MATKNAVGKLENIYTEVTELREAVFKEGQKLYEEWLPLIEREDYRESALNLAYYVALRRRDIRSLQVKLSKWGLSSLGRLEAKVLPQLDALLVVLSKLLDKDLKLLHEIDSSEMAKLRVDYLEKHTDEVFGPKPKKRYTRIMVTMPTEASKDEAFIVKLLEEGMEIARINCGHDDVKTWQKMVKNIKAAEKKTEKKCRIYFDIAGPKIRIDSIFTTQPDARLKTGDQFFITAEESVRAFYEQSIVVGCQNKDILEQLVEGDTIALDDGVVEGRVVSVKPEGAIVQVDRASKAKGVRLKAQKGINFPDTTTKIPLITDKDRQDLEGIQEYADILGFSFVKDVTDVDALQQELENSLGKERAREIPIIVKIETLQSIDHLVDIIIHSAGKNKFGVMIARGDLAVEAGFLRLSELQEEILWVCEAAHVPVIWATQVLETLVKEGIPTRAEITDATMGGRSECVMLNKGDYIEEGLQMLDDLLIRSQEHQYKKSARLRALGIAEKAWRKNK
ncbi:pyruvate kinase [Jeotgalibaca sp. A122]|uniref:pyruvate kinase n=1 Tax=Jeotgalibaca sp. A122 TaxID=3457322 RepID=UPI003FCF929A